MSNKVQGLGQPGHSAYVPINPLNSAENTWNSPAHRSQYRIGSSQLGEAMVCPLLNCPTSSIIFAAAGHYESRCTRCLIDPRPPMTGLEKLRLLQFEFPAKAQKELTALYAGQDVSVEGLCKAKREGEKLIAISFHDCKLVSVSNPRPVPLADF
jgi:hypothetical protein